jgi:hypothetical protein
MWNACYRSDHIKIYETIILPAVLYGCEISSLMLWEEQRETEGL